MARGSSLVVSETYKFRSSNSDPWSTGSYEIRDAYDITSGSNGRNWYERSKLGNDVGLPFALDKVKTSVSLGSINHPLFVGRWYPQQSFNGATIPPKAFLTVEELMAIGTDAIALVTPSQPSFSVLTSLGELARDGLPSMLGTTFWRDKTHLARSASSEYLNLEFGWKPLISDLRNFAQTVKNADEIISQYRRDSGRRVRRRKVMTAVTDSASSNSDIIAGPARLGSGPGSEFLIRTEEVWFSGAFKYYVPVSTDQGGKLAEHLSLANKLLGTDLTPEVVWNLSPWTWAIDWFTNAGSIMSNISNLGNDGLVMEYGYIMNQRVESRSRHSRLSRYPGTSASITVDTKRLRRYKATPFGFGFDMSGLSAKQASILAAVGMSRR